MENYALKKRLSFAERANYKAIESVTKEAVANDVFSNPAARMGHGTASVSEDAEYSLRRFTNDYWLMVTLFRNHWLARRIVERPAQDMCRAWPVLKTEEIEPKLITNFDRMLRKSLISANIQKSITWARLFGGAGALMVIDGHENRLDKKLDLDEIAPRSFKGLIPFDRWSGISPSGTICDDVESPHDYGTPEYYTINGIDGPLFQVHSSRVLRFCGPNVPQPEYQASMYWGISELEIVMEEMRNCDNMNWSVLNLFFRAQILTQVNPELAQLQSGATVSQQAAMKFYQTMQAQNELLSNNSMLLLGKDGKLESHQYSFSGVAEILAQKQMYLAGAANMPVSLLFGRTITGLGQAGDNDIRNYEQTIAQKQNEEMRPQLESKLYPVLLMSQFGEIPEDFELTFPSVRILTEEEKSDLAQKGGQAISEAYGAGIISQKIAATELKALSDKTDIFNNITEEFIDTLDSEVAVPLEIETEEARSGSATFKEANKSNAESNDSADEEKPEHKKSVIEKLIKYLTEFFKEEEKEKAD